MTKKIMNKFNIVKAQNVSWQAYKNLRLEALRNEPQAFGSSYDEQRKDTDREWQDRLSKYVKENSNWMFFASNGNELVGMMGAFQTEEDKKNSTAQIIAVYVKGVFRGNGIAKMLMQELISQLKQAHLKKVTLCVNMNQTMAVALYKKFGFVTLEKENRKLGDGNYYDEYIMEKVL